MPIRFRCTHCSQLMGIARRKAGSEVQCPTCHREVLVPGGEVAEPAAPKPEPARVAPPAPPPVFEQSEFEAYLHGVEGKQILPRPAPPPMAPLPPMRVPGPPAIPHGEPSGSSFPIGSLSPADLTQGLFLSPTWATVLTVVIILLLALSFSVGLLVGRSL